MTTDKDERFTPEKLIQIAVYEGPDDGETVAQRQFVAEEAARDVLAMLDRAGYAIVDKPSGAQSARTRLAWLMWCYQEGYTKVEDRGTNWMEDDAATLHPDDIVLRERLLEMADEILGALHG